MRQRPPILLPADITQASFDLFKALNKSSPEQWSSTSGLHFNNRQHMVHYFTTFYAGTRR
jgi:hypothetical protein